MANNIDQEKYLERKRTDRFNEISPTDIAYPSDMEIYSSSFVSNALAFNVQRKVSRLQLMAHSVVVNSGEQLEDALDQLSSLIIADTRLGDYLPNGVISRLVEFLDDEKYPVKKNYKFQYHSSIVLENVVCSNNGLEVAKLAVPSLIKLISSSHDYVRTQAMATLIALAREFPRYCTSMVENGVLKHLEPLLEDDCIHYVVLKCVGELLVAFCQVNPSLPSDQIKEIADLIRTALHIEYVTSLIPISLAFSILSDRNQVEIGTEFARLRSLTHYTAHVTVISSLRTIGNYVRQGTEKHIEMMLKKGLIVDLVALLYHRHEIVRKEACWIISNINAVANESQIQSFIRMRLVDVLVDFIKSEEYDVKLIATFAISNAILGSNKEQCGDFRTKCVPQLEELAATDDLKMMLKKGLIVDLVALLYHRHEIVRKEACWIISNINAVANESQIQSFIRMRLVDVLVDFIKSEEYDVKLIATFAISNAILGSNKEQCGDFRTKCVPQLEELAATDDLKVRLLISKIKDSLCRQENLYSEK